MSDRTDREERVTVGGEAGEGAGGGGAGTGGKVIGTAQTIGEETTGGYEQTPGNPQNPGGGTERLAEGDADREG